MSNASLRLGRHLIVSSVVLALFVGCSDDTSTSIDCPAGERFNELTGECQEQTRSASNNRGNGRSGGGDAAEVDSGGTSQDGAPSTDDPGERAERCEPDADSDGDGLTNACECDLGTHPYQADSDGDALDDGDEDANQNCTLDPGETDPREADTDVDGLDDRDEIEQGTDPLAPDTDGDGVEDGPEVASGCMEPLDEDTDDDGLLDGVEDADGDGELGVCEDRQYDPSCAQGESDPCSADSDGDGTPDGDEAQYRNCRPQDTDDLSEPDYIENPAVDYKLAVESSVDAAMVSFSTGSAAGHVFGDLSHDYTGFVASLDPDAEEDPARLADEITARVQGEYAGASRRSSGRQITTHDGFKGVVSSIIDLPDGTDLGEARDKILAAAASAGESDVSHSLGGSFTGQSGEPTLFVYQVVSRGPSQYVLVGAFVTRADYQDHAAETGFRVDDLTGGASLARAGGTLEADCVSYEIESEPEVDIIISMDASGSMGEELEALSGFAGEFTDLLDDANVDWRVGVTSVDCDGIKNDGALSPEFRALWPTPSSSWDTVNEICPDIPFQSGSNGALAGGDFTRSASTIASRLDGVNTADLEYTMTMGAAAIDRALPRADGRSAKFREDAAIVLISVTDEEDEFFKKKLDFLGGGNKTLTSSQRAQLQQEAEPWIAYLLDDDIGATAFGLYWPPGENCSTGYDVAHAIDEVVNETGGNGGSICQTDITNTLRGIADATAGLASGLRVRGTAAPQTLTVHHGAVSSGSVVELERSRTDGFDYDPIVNRISFRGANTPVTGDQVVIPYLRWENSVTSCHYDGDCPQEQKMICVDGECR